MTPPLRRAYHTLMNKPRTKPEDLIQALNRAKQVVVFTGAGISTDSGIPDYRGSGGQYSAYQPVYFREFRYQEHKRREYWQHKASVWPAMRDARPTAGHALAARLYETGRLTGVITQNVDGLHEKSGLPSEVVVNLHGSNLEVECLRCDRRVPAGEVLDDLVRVLSEPLPHTSGPHTSGTRSGDDDVPSKEDRNRSLRLPSEDEVPLCPVCGGLLKPATIMFGQNLRPEDLGRAEEMLERCDLLLAMGSTLMVQPAATIPVIAQRNGAILAILTRGETPLDEYADYRIDGDITPLAEAAIAAL